MTKYKIVMKKVFEIEHEPTMDGQEIITDVIEDHFDGLTKADLIDLLDIEVFEWQPKDAWVKKK